jgi:manganese transport protein
MDFRRLLRRHTTGFGGLEIFKYIGPGFLVTVGFIDPGNWAANVAAGAQFGYHLLWIVAIATIMLVILQHNAAHLGIATGLCLAEAATKFFRPWTSRVLLATALLSTAAAAMATVVGAGIGLNMLFQIPVELGAILTTIFAAILLFSNGYRKLERWVIAFVSLIGLAFLFEVLLVRVEWHAALAGWVVPSMPAGSIPIVMSVLGAVVMPHNIFLHSEIIQSRQWNLESDKVIKKQLDYEFYDTLAAMTLGWAINSAMIIVAAAAFFSQGIAVTELQQAQVTLKPLLGHAAAVTFALALVLAGLSSSITSAIAGASIFAGIFGEPYNMKDSHSRLGAAVALLCGLAPSLLIEDQFKGLIWSQIVLSIQLPWTVVALIVLTSSHRVMGRFANPLSHKVLLWIVSLVVIGLNGILLMQILRY